MQILTVDQMPKTRDGLAIVPLDNTSSHYREWLVSIEGRAYCIVEDDGTWVLLHALYNHHCGVDWVNFGRNVDEFLSQYALCLGL